MSMISFVPDGPSIEGNGDMNSFKKKSTGRQMHLSEQFQNGQDLISISIRDLVSDYVSRNKGQRLLLPTIQRSLVWTNEKIINYWDSLLRSWFPGMMLVHDADGDAYDSENNRVDAENGDLELLDGQQRMAAILLGFGTGPLAGTRRLWIDLDAKTKVTHRFALRITSPGQPFGYKPDAPNSRLDVDASRKAWDKWLFGDGMSINWRERQQVIDALRPRYEATLSKDSDLPKIGATNEDVSRALLVLRPRAFLFATGSDLSGNGKNVFPLAPLMRRLANNAEIMPAGEQPEGKIKYEQQATEEFDALLAQDEKAKLEGVLNLAIAVKKVGKELFEEEGSYEEFFKRIGQGGMALSDDELSYSLIKARIPEAREELEAIVSAPEIGRLANPTQIALAGLRLARMQTITGGNIRERIGRPTPEFVSKLPRKEPGGVESDENKEKFKLANRFSEMLTRKYGGEETETGNGELAGLMKHLRQLLGGDPKPHGKFAEETAFPAILLGRLPNEMIDIGLMLVGLNNLQEIDPKARRAFCLWCLTFGDAAKAANALAEQEIAEEPADTRPLGDDILRAVIKRLEDEGKANLAPTLEDIRDLRKTVPPSRFDDGDTGPLLQSWGERYKAAEIDPRISNTINEMRFQSSHGKNALLWLQRDYLRRHFPEYDPTSDRDEDLPIDLDHIVPSERFSFWWQKSCYPSGLSDPDDAKVLNNLRNCRGEIGNLIGNLRWLSSSENRSRGPGRHGKGVDSLKGDADLILDPESLECEDFRNDAQREQNLPQIKFAFGYLIDLQGDEKEAGFAGWTTNDIRLWQYLVQMRQLELLRRLIKDSGIAGLLPQQADRKAIK